MEQEELGKSGIRVSRIGVGMWQAGGKNPWGDDVNDEDSIAAWSGSMRTRRFGPSR